MAASVLWFLRFTAKVNIDPVTIQTKVSPLSYLKDCIQSCLRLFWIPTKKKLPSAWGEIVADINKLSITATQTCKQTPLPLDKHF